MVIKEERQPTVGLEENLCDSQQNMSSSDINYIEKTISNLPNELNANIAQENMAKNADRKSKKRRRDSARNQPFISAPCSENEKPDEISKSDLDELRTVYKKCKAVIRKIETKYGHLLDLDNETNSYTSNEGTDEKCSCKLGKKTVFDESGSEILIEPNLAEHICPHKLVRRFSNENTPQNLQIEYSEPNEVLPDDLKTLVKILQNCELDNSYRYRVISKIQFLRQQYVDDIRNNKKSLIEQLTVNPYEVLSFQGTNLSTITGYK